MEGSWLTPVAGHRPSVRLWFTARDSDAFSSAFGCIPVFPVAVCFQRTHTQHGLYTVRHTEGPAVPVSPSPPGANATPRQHAHSDSQWLQRQAYQAPHNPAAVTLVALVHSALPPPARQCCSLRRLPPVQRCSLWCDTPHAQKVGSLRRCRRLRQCTGAPGAQL